MSAETYPSAFSPEQEGETSSLASRRGVAILILLSLVQFMDVLDASILNIALPSIKHDLRLQPAEPAVGDQRLHPRLRWLPAAGLAPPPTCSAALSECLFRAAAGVGRFSSTGGLAHSECYSSARASPRGLAAAMLQPA